MNGNLIDPGPFQRRPRCRWEEAAAAGGVSAADCEAILLEITRPRLPPLGAPCNFAGNVRMMES